MVSGTFIRNFALFIVTFTLEFTLISLILLLLPQTLNKLRDGDDVLSDNEASYLLKFFRLYDNTFTP